MAGEYLTDGDTGFIGLDSRSNPSSLPAGYVSESINMRMDRGVAKARKGLAKFTDTQVTGDDIKVVGSGSYINSVGQEIFLIISHDYALNRTLIFEYDPEATNLETGATGFSSPKNLTALTGGEVIDSPDGVSVVQAMGNVFISRGFSKRPIVWNMLNTFTVLPVTASGNTHNGHEFPNCKKLMYFQNRLVALGAHHTSTDPLEKRYTVSVSHFLDWKRWDALDAFAINQGGNDETMSIVPWTMNEFLIFMRSSTFYLNVGSSRYATGAVLAQDAALYTLSTDAGCIAPETAVQVAEGVMFLSDNGVYFLRPNPSGNEGIKLLTLSEPVSAPVDDVIQRINKDAVRNACAAYWGNRYYLALPLDGSEVNNHVLVFNFILKAWESVDEYPEGVDFHNFLIAKKDKQRRLYAIDINEGVLLTEEYSADQIGPPSGTPILNFTETIGPFAGQTGFRLDGTQAARLTIGQAPFRPIRARLLTRRYDFKDVRDKRFSSVETDILCAAGGEIQTDAISSNFDTTVTVDNFRSQFEEDSIRRSAVRRISSGIQFRYKTLNSNPSIRSVYVRARPLGKINQSKN